MMLSSDLIKIIKDKIERIGDNEIYVLIKSERENIKVCNIKEIGIDAKGDIFILAIE